MGLKEDVEKMNDKLNDHSWAYSVLEDYKKANRRMFIIILVLIACLMGSIGYTMYLLNSYEVVEETTITQENEDGYNNYIGNDGDIYNGETSNQEDEEGS